MNKEINSNGFGYVDLNLPSGTLWAAMNVGASKPSDAGLYFQWGDTQGYTADQVGTRRGQKNFSSYGYKWNPSGDGNAFTKYTTMKAKLGLEDDAAHVNMGGDWHMPTPKQIAELLNNTVNKWTTLDGVRGRLFKSKKNPSKSIFIPAAGGAWGGSVLGSGDGGGVWSSMLSAGNVGDGQSLGFYSGYTYLGSYSRGGGFSVRGVLDKSLGHKHFEPFQKVLVASGETNTWEPDIYRFYDTKNNIHRCMYYYAGSKETDIIPYEGNEDKLGKQIE